MYLLDSLVGGSLLAITVEPLIDFSNVESVVFIVCIWDAINVH